MYKCGCGGRAVGSPGAYKPSSPIDRGAIYTGNTTGETDCGVMPDVDRLNNMIEFQPDLAHYELYTIIGKGCGESATISLAHHVPSGTPVAVKRVNMETCEVDFSALQHEMLMHRVMHHDNLLPYLGSFAQNNEVWAVMPLMAFGSCRDLIHAHFTEGLPELAVAYILRDVLQALDYLHQRGMIHRAVRASHILISATGRVCLSGLRYAHNMQASGKWTRSVHSLPDHYVRSLLWASPELLEQNLAGYNAKSDIYSLGITACELANGVVPFSDMPITQMLLEKLEGTMPRLLDSITVPEIQEEAMSGTQGDSGIGESVATSEHRNSAFAIFQRTFSQHFHNFVNLCLQSDPKSRPSAASLLQHSFFRQVKRKSEVKTLPDVLQPVSPLSDITSLPKDDSLLESLTTEIENVDIEDDTWSF